MPKRNVVIDGAIGAGKSSVLTSMSPAYIVHPEPLEQWTLLKKAYEEPQRYTFGLQVQVLFTMEHRGTLMQQKGNPFQLVERDAFAATHVFSFLAHESGNMCQEEYDFIVKMGETHMKNTWRPIRILLDVDEETSISRIETRGRSAESSLQHEYARRVVRRYKELKDVGGHFDHVVDGTRPHEEVVREISCILDTEYAELLV